MRVYTAALAATLLPALLAFSRSGRVDEAQPAYGEEVTDGDILKVRLLPSGG